jgi:hypothetical protein
LEHEHENEFIKNTYKIFVSPSDGEVVLTVNAPVLGFESIDALETFIDDIASNIPDMRMALQGKKHPIPADYAKEAMKEFHRAVLTDTLKEHLKEKTDDAKN